MRHNRLFLIAALALASCGGGKKEVKTEEQLVKLKADRDKLDEQIRKLEGARPDTGAKITPVSVMTVQPQHFTSYVEVQADITGEENVNATPRSGGTVTSILVQPGQQVGKGQLLATLDASTVDQQIQALTPQIA